jgi:hypothetical protein
MNTIKKAKSKFVCSECGGTSSQNKVTTYPLQLAAKQLNVGRVAVKECLLCHHLTPTPTGQQKIARCIAAFTALTR